MMGQAARFGYTTSPRMMTNGTTAIMTGYNRLGALGGFEVGVHLVLGIVIEVLVVAVLIALVRWLWKLGSGK